MYFSVIYSVKQIGLFLLVGMKFCVCVLIMSSDASQTSGASGQEADEGSDRSGAGGSLRGLRSFSHDEQQSR